MMTGEQVGVGHDPQRGAAYVENWVAGPGRRSLRDSEGGAGRREDDGFPDRSSDHPGAGAADPDPGRADPRILSRTRAADRTHPEADRSGS